MFGLEKKGKGLFEFDLERDLKKDPTKIKALQKKVDENIHEIKAVLRQGTASEDFDNLGIMLHGYAALKRVLNRIAAQK